MRRKGIEGNPGIPRCYPKLKKKVTVQKHFFSGGVLKVQYETIVTVPLHTQAPKVQLLRVPYLGWQAGQQAGRGCSRPQNQAAHG